MSESARAYACPSCGGSVDEHARICGYCRAPVATVRCAACFHMNVVEALHCSGCGRETGLEPVARDADYQCPHCHVGLAAFDQTSGALFDCAICGGQFVEHAALRELVDRRDLPMVVGAPPSRRFVGVAAPVKYIPCPVCKSMMNRKNFGGSSGVIVDVCRAHGTWFDLGELPRVFAFVELGGLAHERQKRAEEAVEARHKALADATLAMQHPVSSHDFQEPTRFGGSLIELLLR